MSACETEPREFTHEFHLAHALSFRVKIQSGIRIQSDVSASLRHRGRLRQLKRIMNKRSFLLVC